MSDAEGCRVGQDIGEMMIGEGREKWIKLKFLSWSDGVYNKCVKIKQVHVVFLKQKRTQSVV